MLFYKTCSKMVVLTYEISGEFEMTIVQLAFTQSLGGVELVTTYAYNYAGFSTNALQDVNDLVDDFELNVIPALNALQATQCLNVSIYAHAVGYGGASVLRTVTGAGLIAAANANVLPPYLAVYCRDTVGMSYDGTTNLPYAGTRPIRRGGINLPGLTEDWVGLSGASIPISLDSEWNAFEASHLLPIVADTSGNEFKACVWSASRPELPPSPVYPGGRPARPILVAYITDIDPVSVSRLKSRKA